MSCFLDGTLFLFDLKDPFEVLQVAFLIFFLLLDLKDTFEVQRVAFFTENFFDLKETFEVLRVAFLTRNLTSRMLLNQ